MINTEIFTLEMSDKIFKVLPIEIIFRLFVSHYEPLVTEKYNSGNDYDHRINSVNVNFTEY